ncbi:hypothetical protein Droror1_Dr00013264, partial [Drosera rotundifolia]
MYEEAMCPRENSKTHVILTGKALWTVDGVVVGSSGGWLVNNKLEWKKDSLTNWWGLLDQFALLAGAWAKSYELEGSFITTKLHGSSPPHAFSYSLLPNCIIMSRRDFRSDRVDFDLSHRTA